MNNKIKKKKKESYTGGLKISAFIGVLEMGVVSPGKLCYVS
jgi:hypothetical protein